MLRISVNDLALDTGVIKSFNNTNPYWLYLRINMMKVVIHENMIIKYIIYKNIKYSIYNTSPFFIQYLFSQVYKKNKNK